LRQGSPSERQARKAYRRSLPPWIRLRRYLAALAGLAVVVLYFRVVGRDPVTWARHTWNNLRGNLVAVAPSRVTADPPPKHAVAANPPKDAIDGNPATAWAAPVTANAQPNRGSCAFGALNPGLLLTLPQTTTVRAIAVRAGLDATDISRTLYPRPRELDLGFSRSQCQRVVLGDNPNWQKISIRPVATNSVRISIATVYPAKRTDREQLAHISEVRLLARPN
jgi:hypothetical protein